MALTLHQLDCFLATMARSSFTAAAEHLGLSQPSLSEQIRQLERHLGTQLFHRLGRGVAPTDAALEFEGHARAALSAVDAGTRTVVGAGQVMSGSIRFGLFGAAHLYLARDLVASVLAEHPELRISLIGQNSRDVIADVVAGRIEAALVALPPENHDQLVVRPVARDELVYVSRDPDRVRSSITPDQLIEADLVLSEVTWRDDDFTRQQLIRLAQSASGRLRPRIEVENVEVALELVASGYADTITARAVAAQMASHLSAPLHSAPLAPSIFDQFAIVHRVGTVLSAPTRVMIDHATRLIRHVTNTQG